MLCSEEYPVTDERRTTGKRSKKIYVLWGAALALLLTAGLVCWLVVVPAWRTRSAVARVEKASYVGMKGFGDVYQFNERAAEECVSELGGPTEAVRGLRLYLRLPSKFTPHRKTAKFMLCLCGGAALGELIQLLEDEDIQVRCSAIRALGAIEKAPAYTALFEALAEEDRTAHSAAFGALRRTTSPAVIDPAIAALKGECTSARYTAALVLGYVRGPGRIRPLTSALSDPEANVRARAAESLGLSSDRQAAEPLARALRDSNGRVRYEAARALARLRDPRTVGALVAAMKSKDTNTAAAAALLAIGEDAVPAVIGALRSENALARMQAVSVLGRICDSRAVSPLIALLRDKNDGVRMVAAKALGWLGDPRAVEDLRKRERDTSVSVRDAADKALGRIKAAASEQDRGRFEGQWRSMSIPSDIAFSRGGYFKRQWPGGPYGMIVSNCSGEWRRRGRQLTVTVKQVWHHPRYPASEARSTPYSEEWTVVLVAGKLLVLSETGKDRWEYCRIGSAEAPKDRDDADFPRRSDEKTAKQKPEKQPR